MAEQAERLGNPFPAAARTWIGKWGPRIETWQNEVADLTYLCGISKPEDHDWKKLIQDLLFSLDGVVVAAKEASDFPLSGKEGPEQDGTASLCHMIVRSMSYIRDHYRAMQELLSALS
jgi:hypothetical protein